MNRSWPTHPVSTERAQDATVPLILLIGAAWFAAVALASVAGLFERIAQFSAPAYGGVIAASIGAAVLLYVVRPRLTRVVDGVPVRALTLFHVPRVIGGVALLGYGLSGTLPPLFAALVGFGDIVAALAASVVLFVPSPRPRLLVGIHVIGLADLATGLSTGMVLGLTGETRLVALAQLPLSLIVLFWVPLLAVAHVAALRQLARG